MTLENGAYVLCIGVLLTGAWYCWPDIVYVAQLYLSRLQSADASELYRLLCVPCGILLILVVLVLGWAWGHTGRKI